MRFYRRLIEDNLKVLPHGPLTILDIGCGTGALASVLAEKGHQVTGIDGSRRMIDRARHFTRNHTIEFIEADAFDLLASDDRSPPLTRRYDLVVASYVLHGLKQPLRLVLYQGMKMLAKKQVIIMDYNQHRHMLVSLIEWLERGDYFRFIQTVESEIHRCFPVVRVIPVGKRMSWYLCECSHSELD